MPVRMVNMKLMSRICDWQGDGEADTPTDNCGSENRFCFLEDKSAKMCQNAQKVYPVYTNSTSEFIPRK